MKESWMEKLIELLNEYEKDWLNEFEKYTERWYCERTKQILCGKWENNNELTPYEIISKQYWFIEWLVENDKINLNKIKLFSIFKEDWYYNAYESVLMALSISDTPIEFLCSMLK